MQRFAATLAALALAACVTEGTMPGWINGPRGDPEGRVVLHFHADPQTAVSALSLRLPDGESFVGAAVPHRETGHRLGLVGGPVGGFGPYAGLTAGNDVADALTTGNQQAMLRGDRGTVMSCSFTTAAGRLDSGGVGHCTLSDGRLVTFKF